MNRIPDKKQILPVYAIGVTILYTWTILVTIRETLFNWVLFLNAVEILLSFSYLMTGALLESLLLIMILIFLGWALPKKAFSEKFVSRGSILAISFLTSIMYYYTQTPLGEAFVDIYKWGIFFVSSAAILLFIAESFRPVEQFIDMIANRSLIFLYIYMPISFIAIIVVIIQNLG